MRMAHGVIKNKPGARADGPNWKHWNFQDGDAVTMFMQELLCSVFVSFSWQDELMMDFKQSRMNYVSTTMNLISTMRLLALFIKLI